jgi:hypothetical protein
MSLRVMVVLPLPVPPAMPMTMTLSIGDDPPVSVFSPFYHIRCKVSRMFTAYSD